MRWVYIWSCFFSGTMGTERAGTTNKVSTFRAAAHAAANVLELPPDVVDIVSRLARILLHVHMSFLLL